MTQGQADGVVSTNVRTTDHDGVMVAVVTGEIDMTSVDTVRAGVEEQLDKSPTGLVVHLAVTFLGSAGLSMLVELHNRARGEGIPFVVVATEHAARRPLVATAMDQVVTLVDSVEEAVRSLKPAAESR